MKLSIIVPVFNTEKYVRECIESIVNQEDDCFKETELIIVNDGTEDNSIDRISDIISGYSNIKLINKENEGLSIARNEGIRCACGEYIWFIDSDDWISADSLRLLFPLLDGKNDLIKIYAAIHNDKSDEYPFIPFTMATSFSGKESFFNKTAQNSRAVLLIYRKQYLEDKNLRFMPGVFHEDYEFCPRASYLSEYTTVLPHHLYFIRRTINDGRKSITTTVNPKRSFDILICSKSLDDFNRSIVTEKHIRKIIDTWIAQGMTTALENIIQSSKDEIEKFNSEYFSCYQNLNKCLINGKFKNKIEGILFILFPRNITRAYSFLNAFNPRKIRLKRR